MREWRAILEDKNSGSGPNNVSHVISLLLRVPVPVLRSLIQGTIVHDYAAGNVDVRRAVEEAGGLAGVYVLGMTRSPITHTLLTSTEWAEYQKRLDDYLDENNDVFWRQADKALKLKGDNGGERAFKAARGKTASHRHAVRFRVNRDYPDTPQQQAPIYIGVSEGTQGRLAGHLSPTDQGKSSKTWKLHQSILRTMRIGKACGFTLVALIQPRELVLGEILFTMMGNSLLEDRGLNAAPPGALDPEPKHRFDSEHRSLLMGHLRQSLPVAKRQLDKHQERVAKRQRLEEDEEPIEAILEAAEKAAEARKVREAEIEMAAELAEQALQWHQRTMNRYSKAA
jgi:hypothetical protein